MRTASTDQDVHEQDSPFENVENRIARINRQLEDIYTCIGLLERSIKAFDRWSGMEQVCFGVPDPDVKR
jgi:hypothetical protein